MTLTTNRPRIPMSPERFAALREEAQRKRIGAPATRENWERHLSFHDGLPLQAARTLSELIMEVQRLTERVAKLEAERVGKRNRG